MSARDADVRAASGSGSGTEDPDDTLFEFEKMVGNTATREAGVIRGINAGGLPWVVDEAEAKLSVDGTLEVKVEGLIIPRLGRNPAGQFSAVLSCLTERMVDGAVTVVQADPVMTQPFAASTEGDAETMQRLSNIPEPCLAPVVFVTNGAGTAWFAVTGF